MYLILSSDDAPDKVCPKKYGCCAIDGKLVVLVASSVPFILRVSEVDVNSNFLS